MITILYLDSPRINRQANVAAHFRALAGFAAQAGMPVSSRVAFSVDEARRALQACQAGILYLLGHSDGHGGVVIGGKAALDGRGLSAWLPRRVERLPRAIVFNTCDAVSSGLVSAALAAGVSSVAASTNSIPISAMCAYSESLFRNWLGGGVLLFDAVQVANAEFAAAGLCFEVFGDPSALLCPATLISSQSVP